MAKPKSPLLSLGARGTIADTLTFQKRGQQTIVREKPIPTDPYSLAQAYQRWDYRDYAYLWTLLSDSEKQVYRTKASRYHITGFSQWMRENLKALTGLAGRWHLDEKTGAVAYDSSRNSNNGTIVGATPTTGLINGALSFDGVNDRIVVPMSPTLHLPGPLSYEWFMYPKSEGQAGFGRAFEIFGIIVSTFAGVASDTFGTSVLTTAGVSSINAAVGGVPFNQWSYCCMTYDLIRIRLTINTTTYLGNIRNAPLVNYSAIPLIIGNRIAFARTFDGYLDHFTTYDYALDETQKLRHSERRYP